jgi:transcriptional regulator with XRE-family HTH domain
MSESELKLTQCEIAAALGVSQARVSRLAAAGMPTTSVAEAQAWRKRHLDARLTRRRRRLRRAPAGDDAMEAAQLRRALAEAGKAELVLAKQRGELLRRADVLRHWRGMVLSMRSRLLLLPPACAPLVIGKSVGEVEEILRRRVHEALDEISRDGAP